MDRFIELQQECDVYNNLDLKSSMDRFIDPLNILLRTIFVYLKSSMDRFIDSCRFEKLQRKVI